LEGAQHRPHLKNSDGGDECWRWFDAEDLFGPLNIYREVERNILGFFNMLVLGPWAARRVGWGETVRWPRQLPCEDWGSFIGEH